MAGILTIPSGILRQKCEPVEKINSDILALAEELCNALGELQGGMILIGISAPQLGVSVRMFAFRGNPYSDVPDIRIAINPELTLRGKARVVIESCLSIPGRNFLVSRHKLVKLTYTDAHGQRHVCKARGMVAQGIQHELDHLDGILIDRK